MLQLAEGLSDRQAADAVRARIDWKYLLCLELTDPGFHYSVLSEFRERLIVGEAEEQIFNRVLAICRNKGLVRKRGQQRTDSTEVLAAIRTLNRLELVGETLRAALNALAVVAPDWMRAHSQPEWIERYGPRVSDYHLPADEKERVAYTTLVGADGLSLLTAIWSESSLPWLREIPAVKILWRVWLQNYTWVDDQHLRWREADEVPPASQAIRTPYDPEAQFSQKRSTAWVGYKVHFTETCDPDLPRLVTQVETTSATTQDNQALPLIHQALQTRDCLPATHLVDCGYTSVEEVITSRRDYDIDLLGPMRTDHAWQARENQGFTAQDFVIDWEAQHAICSAGQKSLHWMPALNNRDRAVIQIKFSKRDCRICLLQPQCTHSTPPRRSITVRPKELHQALLEARQRENTEAFKEQYAARAGIEGTLSQGVRAFGLRQARYIGLAKTHLQHVLTAMALNITRVLVWLSGDRPAQTRSSAFVRLHHMAA
jgi:transposase